MENNPYSTPQSNLDNEQSVYEPNTSGVFSFSGRIGRLRYLAYLMLMYLIFAAAVGVPAAILIPMTGGGTEINVPVIILGLIVFIMYIAMIVYVFVYAIRRLNDCGRSGWLSLLLMVPFLNLFISLYLMFAPGTEGNNQYGAPPRANHAGIYLGAIAPIFLIGVLAAVAIPAYQDYVKRAQDAQMQQIQQMQELTQE